MSHASDTWIVVPAYNESATLGGVVAPLKTEGYSVVVTDDGSSDGTADMAGRLGAHVCRHPRNLGQGAALRTGFEFALKQGARFLVTFDADGQHTASDIPGLVAPIRNGMVDVALGSRFLSGSRALDIPPSRLVLLRIARALARLGTGLRVTDAHCGIRALSAEAARRIRITQYGMAHADEILWRIAEERLRWTEVPVTVVYTPYSLAKGQRLSGVGPILRDRLIAAFRDRSLRASMR